MRRLVHLNFADAVTVAGKEFELLVKIPGLPTTRLSSRAAEGPSTLVHRTLADHTGSVRG